MKLFTSYTGNPKMAKSIGKYLPIILHLAPHTMSGHNVCSSSSPACRATCLNYAGHGRYPRVQLARIARNNLYFSDRASFMALLYADINSLLRKCHKDKRKPAVRLNGTSDIVWEKVWPQIFSDFLTVQFYDYTKHLKRVQKGWKLPSNYHLTFSRSENNQENCEVALANGFNVAVIFEKKPKKYLGHIVRDGDKHDLRFLDKPGIIGLTPKSRARHDKTGFVVR